MYPNSTWLAPSSYRFDVLTFILEYRKVYYLFNLSSKVKLRCEMLDVRLLTGAAKILLALVRAGKPLSSSKLEEATGMSHSLLDRNTR